MPFFKITLYSKVFSFAIQLYWFLIIRFPIENLVERFIWTGYTQASGIAELEWYAGKKQYCHETKKWNMVLETGQEEDQHFDYSHYKRMCQFDDLIYGRWDGRTITVKEVREFCIKELEANPLYKRAGMAYNCQSYVERLTKFIV